MLRVTIQFVDDPVLYLVDAKFLGNNKGFSKQI